MTRSPSRFPWRWFAIIFAVGLLVLGGWWVKRTPSAASQPIAVNPTPPRGTDAPRPPASERVPPDVAPPPATIAASENRSRDVVVPSAEILQAIKTNAAPGRMVFLDFILDRAGLRLVGASGAAGRAKPAGSRAGFGFVHYEVFGPGGQLLLDGSVEDPTRRRIEHPAASNDGRIASTVEFTDGGPLSVRLPGEVAAARIVFFRYKNPLAPSPESRENLGEFVLRPQP